MLSFYVMIFIVKNGKCFMNWTAGDTVEWAYDLPHAAANIGIEDRYTLQVTGWL